jgi:hypothetical protein
MKRFFATGVLAICAATFVFLACEKKNDNNAITPGYKADTGTGANPNPNNVTTTGVVPPNTNEPTGNSTTNVGGSGWTFTSCGTATQVTATSISAINGSEKVTLNFLSPPATGTYNVSSSLINANSVVVIVENARNQPSGITWYGAGGTISVVTSSNSINATFISSSTNPVVCKRQTHQFPAVYLSGTMGCI